MNQYYVNALSRLFQVLISREWSIVEVHHLFDLMYVVVHYSRMIHKADTPESVSLARWSKKEAEEQLGEFMKAHCFGSEIRDTVWYLVAQSR